jgi:hypothetical protein
MSQRSKVRNVTSPIFIEVPDAVRDIPFPSKTSAASATLVYIALEERPHSELVTRGVKMLLKRLQTAR